MRLTFDHDHVDIDGADRRLRQTFAFLQQIRDVFSTHVLVRPLTVCKQLPHRDACNSSLQMNTH